MTQYSAVVSVSGSPTLDHTASGRMHNHVTGGTIQIPPPNQMPQGPLGFRLGTNDSNVSYVQRTDAGLIDGCDILAMPMIGDAYHLFNTGAEYFIIGRNQLLPSGLQGQHRTYFRSVHGGGYNVHRGDRGATIRAVMDTDNGNVNLIAPALMGYAPGGYRRGYALRIIYAAPTPTYFIQVNGGAASIRGMPGNYFMMDTVGQVVDLDFDSAEWFIVGHYKPGSVPNKP